MKNKVVKTILALTVALIVCVVFVSGCALSPHDWFVKTIKTHYYYPVPEEAFEGDDYKAIANKYLDRYSAYYTAEEYAEVIKSNEGSKSGIGISYAYVDGKGVYISTVVGNSPAYKNGLRAGEWLEGGSVGENEVQFTSSADFVNLIDSAADGVNINLTSVEGATYTVAKSEYTASYTYMATNKEAWVFTDSADGGLGIVSEYSAIIPYLPDNTAYINLSQFFGTAAKEFDVLVKKFNSENCTSLILDLRSDGGGYVSIMQSIAYAFSGSTKTLAMLSRDKNGKEVKFNCAKAVQNASTLPRDIKVYVLANSGTASASEALIGAMHCYGFLPYENIFVSDYSEEYMQWLKSTGQELKTAQSYGKGIMQSTYVNPSTKDALKLTTAGIFWPDKTTGIHDKGVTVADGCIPVRADWEFTKSDEELQRVVEIIKNR